MFACGSVAYQHFPYIAALPLGIIDSILWIACGWFGLRKPLVTLSALFSVISGCLLGLLAKLYADLGYEDLFIYAAGMTATIFLILSVTVFLTKRNFRFLRGFLFLQFWVLLFGIIANIFLRLDWLDLALSSLAVAAFSAFILYDTGRLIDKERGGNPLQHSFELFLDILGLFQWLLRLISRK